MKIMNRCRERIVRMPFAAMTITSPDFFRQMQDERNIPHDIWKGDDVRAQKLLEYVFPYGGMDIYLGNEEIIWTQRRATGQWMQEVYSFSWLRDLSTLENTDRAAEAAKLARFYLWRWIGDKNLPSPARHPDIAGERIAMWFYYGGWITQRAQPAFKKRFLRRLVRDVESHRARVLSLREKAGFSALKGLIVACRFIAEYQKDIENIIPLLHLSIGERIAEDGWHRSRCPEQQLKSLRQLVEIRELLRGDATGKAGDDGEETTAVVRVEDDLLDATIHRMAGMLRLCMHGDGRLALFNDTVEGREAAISAVLDRTGGFLSIPSQAPDGGFQRLAMKDSVVIMDSGAPLRNHSRTHFGTLSFEFSHHNERVVVNCGAFRGSDAGWKEACRKTAAHSTVIIAGQDSVPPLPQELLNLAHVPAVVVERSETPSSIEVTATYNGYVPQFHLLHQRHITLCDNGRRVEGRDKLFAVDDTVIIADGMEAVVRFHLHPEVRVSKSDDAKFTLKMPSGNNWLFSASPEYGVTFMESVYMGGTGKPAKTHQLVINVSKLDGDTEISWSFERG